MILITTRMRKPRKTQNTYMKQVRVNSSDQMRAKCSRLSLFLHRSIYNLWMKYMQTRWIFVKMIEFFIYTWFFNFYTKLFPSTVWSILFCYLSFSSKYGYTIFKAMQKELGGKAEEAALFTCGLKLKPYETIAHLIKGACKGMGTKDLLLTTTIIRFQHIMVR